MIIIKYSRNEKSEQMRNNYRVLGGIGNNILKSRL